jgi:hypothetical protein
VRAGIDGSTAADTQPPVGRLGDADAATPAQPGGGNAVMSCLSWLDRLLPVWIVAAMVLGVLLGSFVPQVRSPVHVCCLRAVWRPAVAQSHQACPVAALALATCCA